MIDFTVPTVAEIEATQQDAVAQVDAIVAEIVAAEGPRSFANTLLRLEDAYDVLERAQGRHGFMGYVAEDKTVRGAADQLREALEKYEIELGFREDLYAVVTTYADTAEARSLTGEAQRLLEWTLRDYKRDGFGLPPEQRGRVRELKQRLVELDVLFRRNIDAYDDAILVRREELAGLPQTYIEGLRTDERDGDTFYRVSLDYPEMYPFLDNAESEALRRELMIKNYRKGGLEKRNAPRRGDRRPGRVGAHPRLRVLGRLRARAAHGEDAGSGARLPRRSGREGRAERARDVEAMREAKRAHTGDPTAEVQLWDWRFYHNYLLKTRYAVDDFEVAKYFPLDAVLGGLFETMQTLLNVRFEAVRRLTPGMRT